MVRKDFKNVLEDIKREADEFNASRELQKDAGIPSLKRKRPAPLRTEPKDVKHNIRRDDHYISLYGRREERGRKEQSPDPTPSPPQERKKESGRGRGGRPHSRGRGRRSQSRPSRPISRESSESSESSDPDSLFVSESRRKKTDRTRGGRAESRDLRRAATFTGEVDLREGPREPREDVRDPTGGDTPKSWDPLEGDRHLRSRWYQQRRSTISHVNEPAPMKGLPPRAPNWGSTARRTFSFGSPSRAPAWGGSRDSQRDDDRRSSRRDDDRRYYQRDSDRRDFLRDSRDDSRRGHHAESSRHGYDRDNTRRDDYRQDSRRDDPRGGSRRSFNRLGSGRDHDRDYLNRDHDHYEPRRDDDRNNRDSGRSPRRDYDRRSRR